METKRLIKYSILPHEVDLAWECRVFWQSCKGHHFIDKNALLGCEAWLERHRKDRGHDMLQSNWGAVEERAREQGEDSLRGLSNWLDRQDKQEVRAYLAYLPASQRKAWERIILKREPQDTTEYWLD